MQKVIGSPGRATNTAAIKFNLRERKYGQSSMQLASQCNLFKFKLAKYHENSKGFLL